MSDKEETDSNMSSNSSLKSAEFRSFYKISGTSANSTDSDSDSDKTAQESAVPTHKISHDDERKIRKNISERVRPDIHIFPSTVREYLTQTHGDIISTLRELPGRQHPVVIAGGSLLALIDEANTETPAPKDVHCDVCVFSQREPLLVLTITSGNEKKNNVTSYNSQLARRIIQSVRKNTRYSFSAVHGVVEESLCQNHEKFQEKVAKLQRDAHVMSIPPALVMTDKKCEDIIQPILQLLSVDPPEQSKPSADKGDANHNTRLQFFRFLGKTMPAHSEEKELQQLKRDIDLHEACQKGILYDVQNIISQGIVDINCQGKLGRTPVMTAALAGQEAVFNYLVGKDTRMKNIDEKNNNILHLACIGGNVNIVKYIVKNKLIDTESKGYAGKTPVFFAAQKGNKDVFDLIVSCNCNLSGVDEQKNNILHEACYGGNVEIVKKILSNNIAKVESKGFEGRTPIQAAAENGHIDVFDLLRRNECDLESVDDNQNNILHVACIGGNTDMVKHILSLNIVGIDSKGKAGQTPVMTAAEMGHWKVVDLLESKGCSLQAEDDNRNNIVHVACVGGDVDTVKGIISRQIVNMDDTEESRKTPVMKAAENGHRGVVVFLVNKGCNLKTVDRKNNNILHLACRGGNTRLVKYLMTLKDVEEMKKAKNKKMRTPYSEANIKRHTEIARLLKGGK